MSDVVSETNHKGHFLNHLHRKKICRPILEDISIEDIKNHYDLENAKIHQNNPYEPKKTTYEPKKPKITHLIVIIVIKYSK